MAELQQSFIEYADDHEKETMELLKTLARIPAPSNHEEKRAAFCRNWLEEMGAEGVCIDEALNVIYPADVREGQDFDIYMAHLDVVFPDMEELPLEEKDGRIYCPGVGDDTACAVCLLMAAKYIAALIKSGSYDAFAGNHDTGLMLVWNTGEEGLGNLKGTKEIFKKYGSRVRNFCTFDSQTDKIVTRAVGSIRYEVEIHTEGGHSYSKFGNDNAIEKMAELITRLYRIPLPAVGKTTYNVGEISGGTSINTIAQSARMLYEYRSDRKENLDYMTEQFQSILAECRESGLDITCKEIGNRPCGKENDPQKNKELIKRAVKAVQNAAGIIPIENSGSTDCNIPLSLGIPAVCVGCYEGSGAHTREEFIETSSVKTGVRIVLEMILL